MKGGDMNLEAQTDTLRFVVKSKPHKAGEGLFSTPTWNPETLE